MQYKLDDFAFDLRRSALPDQTWVSSGSTTVRAVPRTVCTVEGLFSPPYAAGDLALGVRLLVDGHEVSDGAGPGVEGHGLLPAGGTWRPDHIERRGTYHHRTRTPVASLSVSSTVTPLHRTAGFVLAVSVRNRGEAPVTVGLRPELSPGHPRLVDLGEWTWLPPRPATTRATPTGPHRWRGDGVDVTLELDRPDATLAPGASAGFHVTVRLGPARPTIEPTGDGCVLAADATAAWGHRLGAATRDLPALHSDVPGLEEYWRRSLASGLVCLWDNPAFVTQPFVATSGLDGGAVCSYVWDTGGYAPHLLTAMLHESALDVLEAMLDADLAEHYAIAPSGKGVGLAYAYTGWSLVRLAEAVAARHGMSARTVLRLYDTARRLEARFAVRGELLDYGTQHNLLEMRGSGWEHVVASPNAERAYYLDALAALSDQTGAGLPAAQLRDQAARIRAAVVATLWDADAGWFRSLYPDGSSEVVWSIQAYDALRAGAANDGIAGALVGRLRPGAFLGDYGVSSVSETDEIHYEIADNDWSGAGAYTGESPMLAATLWERGYEELAWDVLARLLWMGRHFPYFPQEHYSDRPASPPTGRRANVVAGLAGAEAIVTGLAGVHLKIDGSVTVTPHRCPAGTVQLHGLSVAGHTLDVLLTPDHAQVVVDGTASSVPYGNTIVAITARPRNRRAIANVQSRAYATPGGSP